MVNDGITYCPNGFSMLLGENSLPNSHHHPKKESVSNTSAEYVCDMFDDTHRSLIHPQTHQYDPVCILLSPLLKTTLTG